MNSPENFTSIQVRGERIPMGFKPPFDVIGIDENNKETVIKAGFKSSQVAEIWMRLYLEKYAASLFPRDEDC